MRDLLLSMIAGRSYREGDFTLSSGLKSPFYIDLKPTILHPEGATLFGSMGVEWILKENLMFDGVGGSPWALILWSWQSPLPPSGKGSCFRQP